MGWSKSLINRQVSLVRVVLALALVLAGVAAGYSLSDARAQGEDETIYACVNEWNGATRIVDADQDCGRSEYSESWSKEGSPGAPGTPGMPGVDGISGYEIKTSSVHLENIFSGSTSLVCPDGKVALAGGYLESEPDIEPWGDRPLFSVEDPNLAVSWQFLFASTTGAPASGTVELWVACANMPT